MYFFARFFFEWLLRAVCYPNEVEYDLLCAKKTSVPLQLGDKSRVGSLRVEFEKMKWLDRTIILIVQANGGKSQHGQKKKSSRVGDI